MYMTKFWFDFISTLSKAKKNTPPVGFEPTTFELEVQHANPLRHGGYPLLVEEVLLYQKYYTTFIIISWTICHIKADHKTLVILVCARSIFNFAFIKKPFVVEFIGMGRGLVLLPFALLAYVGLHLWKRILCTDPLRISLCSCVREHCMIVYTVLSAVSNVNKHASNKFVLENSPKKIRELINSCLQLTIRSRVRDSYRVIVVKGAVRVKYHA